LVVGTSTGGSLFYRNHGSPTQPLFKLEAGFANPIYGMLAASFAAPSFGDVDGDGDPDVWIGGGDGRPFAIENNVTYPGGFGSGLGSGSGKFYSRKSGVQNPLFKEKWGNAKWDNFRTNAHILDLDGDGDGDIILATATGKISVLLKTGTYRSSAYDPAMGRAMMTRVPIYKLAALQEFFPHFPPAPYPIEYPTDELDKPTQWDSIALVSGDVDNDGQTELLLVNDGTITMFDDPADLTFAPSQSRPMLTEYNLEGECNQIAVADINGDGRSDLVLGLRSGYLRYFEADGCVPPARAERAQKTARELRNRAMPTTSSMRERSGREGRAPSLARAERRARWASAFSCASGAAGEASAFSCTSGAAGKRGERLPLRERSGGREGRAPSLLSLHTPTTTAPPPPLTPPPSPPGTTARSARWDPTCPPNPPPRRASRAPRGRPRSRRTPRSARPPPPVSTPTTPPNPPSRAPPAP
jgi:hypothetical protein